MGDADLVDEFAANRQTHLHFASVDADCAERGGEGGLSKMDSTRELENLRIAHGRVLEIRERNPARFQSAGHDLAAREFRFRPVDGNVDRKRFEASRRRLDLDCDL